MSVVPDFNEKTNSNPARFRNLFAEKDLMEPLLET
jgi:hypothetical protein